MSHYTVLICISNEEMETEGLNAVLDRKLAPFNENDRVERYKSFEDGSPSDHWWLSALKRAAAKIDGDDPLTEKAIQYLEMLGDNPAWAEFVLAYNTHYGHGTEVSVDGDDGDSETMYVDSESGRAYTWSTYNPQSKWDWWTIGGRWQRSFKTVPEPDPKLLINGSPGTFGDNGRPEFNLDGSLYCDGGQLRFLDLDGMRDERAQDQLKKYDLYWALVKEHGEPTSWASLTQGLDAEMDRVQRREAIQAARAAYGSQPLIKAAEAAELSYIMGPTVEETYGMSREDFETGARLEAVPGYALLTLAGDWAAPGVMGWFGMSSESPGEQEAFRVQTNRYIDELPKDNWVVLVDAHI